MDCFDTETLARNVRVTCGLCSSACELRDCDCEPHMKIQRGQHLHMRCPTHNRPPFTPFIVQVSVSGDEA